MPTYTYACKKCEKVFEVSHGITRDAMKTCKEIEEAACEENGEVQIQIGNVNHSWTNKRWTGKS